MGNGKSDNVRFAGMLLLHSAQDKGSGKAAAKKKGNEGVAPEGGCSRWPTAPQPAKR